MMAVWTPLTDRGLFGFGSTSFAADHPLHLGSPVKYIASTLALHLVYGAVVGWLNPAWIRSPGVPRPEMSGTAS